MTLGARKCSVRAREWETGGRVVEGCLRPRRRVVTLLTGLRESRLHVIGIRRSLEILQMATDAGSVRRRQVVVSVHVTLTALHRRVSTGQREAGGRMVKRGVVPCRRRMALLAGGREAGLHVIRIGRAVEVLHVARCAIGRRSHELAVDMALRAGHAHVRASQRELRKGVVIEGRRIPRACAMAGLASRREASLRVWWIIGLIKVGQVTAHAGCGRVVELPARVACGAIQGRMCSGQRESGELQVIELRAHPVIHRVALFALDRQAQGDVVDADGLCINEILLVA